MVELVFISGFLVIFGIFYLHYSTRNKERLALIEKGADASVFVSKRSTEAPPVWKIVLLNFGLLFIGVGLGILLGFLLNNVLDVGNQGATISASVFVMAGVGLVVGFFLTRKLIK